ncbi:hypothetical protein HNV12_19465 [Methanococcoides sp. SA1]|nr:hypothetical protein [Methanococcoides sp. SA1]
MRRYQKEIAVFVLQELCEHVYDSTTICELCRVLKEYFALVAVYCCDLIQRMKIELDMYILTDNF